MHTTPGATEAPSRIVDPPGTMRTLSPMSVSRTGYVCLSKNLKFFPSDMSMRVPMRKPSNNPCLIHEWSSQSPSAFLSAARISPRLSAPLNSLNIAVSAGVKNPSRRSASASIRSRNCMRRFLQQINLAEDLAHARACLFLHGHEWQTEFLFDHPHQREPGLHWTRTRLDEVSFH